MVEIGTLFARAQAMGSLPTLKSGSKSGEGNADGFADLFRRASSGDLGTARSSGGFPEGAKPVKVKRSETEIPEDLTEIPDELAALAGQSIIHIQPAAEAEAVSDEINTEQIILPADGGEVASILEGNMDIEAQMTVTTGEELPPDFEAAVDAALAAETTQTDEELTARMPQAAGQIQENTAAVDTKEPQAEPVDDAEAQGPCPLENKNDSAKEARSSSNEQGRSEEDAAEKDPSRLFGTEQKVDITPERLASAEKLNTAQMPHQTTATTETLFDTMVESIRVAESKFMEIQLKPDYLGKVSIQLSLGESGMEIKIKAEDSGVKDLIAGQIAQLSSTLSEKGVKVTQIDVIYAEVSEHAFGQSASEGNRHFRESNGSASGGGSVGFGPGFGSGHAEDAAAVSMLDTGLSSVEYSA